MIIYTATQQETKTLNITNIESTPSIVYINDVIFDDVILAQGNPNLRVLELKLNDGDVVSAKDNDLINYTIVDSLPIEPTITETPIEPII